MSSDSDYYDTVKQLAREKRELFGATSENIGLKFIRNVYKQEGIKIKLSKAGKLRKLKAAYFNDECGADVLLSDKLPNEAKIFALIHELKHHYLDSSSRDVLCLAKYDEEPLKEKSAEVFAAEFIWPEAEFEIALKNFGLRKENCTPELVVKFKEYANVPVSYKFIIKRLEWFKIIKKKEYAKVKFLLLEYSLLGMPYHIRRLQNRSFHSNRTYNTL